MLRLSAVVALALLTISHAAAGPNVAGKFDYYVLALSWSPTWCAVTGDAKNAAQCKPQYAFGFTLHGLWPQNERGWPSYCRTSQPPPSRRMTAAMRDIMGSAGLAWHQWDKHGRCSGLSAAAYFSAARKAYSRIKIPSVFRNLLRPVKLPATDVKATFLHANPALRPDMITVTCKRNYFNEVRICLTKDLKPRACGTDIKPDCKQRVIFPPVR